jgi:NAD(P)-dependent dehydrogenase (short-subunit alcohol dehydrogenase family)
MKTALITGGNRGIGLELCKQLDKQGWQVILCSRNFYKGEKAAMGLSENVIVKQLDISSPKSIHSIYQQVKEQCTSLDLLINNAALGESAYDNLVKLKTANFIKKHFKPIYLFLKKAKPELKHLNLFSEDVNVCNVSLDNVKFIMETNLFGSWRMIQTFIPLLEKSTDGQIINISSGMGTFNELRGLYPGYSISKASLNALTVMFSQVLKNNNIRVNAVCPGWVKTDMGGHNAPRSLEEGADTIVWLAMHEKEATGKLFKDRKVINW